MVSGRSCDANNKQERLAARDHAPVTTVGSVTAILQCPARSPHLPDVSDGSSRDGF